MFSETRVFLFKCTECESIISVEFEKDDEIKKVQNNKAIVECPCGADCKVLLD